MEMNALSPWHLLLILLAFLLLVGYKKLPDATRSLGRSLRIFRSEVRELTDRDTAQGVSAAEAEPEAPTRPVAELEREAAAAEALAARLRARVTASTDDRQSAS
jgi:sec-independent protein translocase protein TatA